jgi:hypothetical protein
MKVGSLEASLPFGTTLALSAASPAGIPVTIADQDD